MSTVHRLRKPVASTTALAQRKRALTVAIVVALAIAGVLAYLLAGCGGGSSTTPPPPPPVIFQALTATEVTNIATAAAASVSTDTLVIAVVDRQGKVLGVFHKAGAPIGALSPGNFSAMENADDVDVEMARTGGAMDVDEYAAFVGATSNGFGGFFGALPPPGAVFLGGVVLPAVTNTTPPNGIGTGAAAGGTWVIAATNGTGTPEFGDLVAPTAGALGGLSAVDVKGILDNAETEANLT